MGNKQKKSDVVFCGLMRLPELFKKSINDLVLLRKEGLVDKIIFSTWIGEIKDKEMLDFLRKNEILLIESEEPKDRGAGNIWCQMKSLEVALNKMGKDKFVLKTRSDVYIEIKFLRKLFSEKEKLLKIIKNLPKGNIFKYKVWIVWFELTRPFYFADECFFGYYNDLRKLVNYEGKYDEEYNIGAGISHIRRFIHPFVNDYPILYDSLGKFNDWTPMKEKLKHFLAYKLKLKEFKLLRKMHENNRFRNLKNKLKDKEYIDILAVYYSILHSHFYVDGDSFPNQVTFRDSSIPRIKLDSKNIDNNFSKEKTILPYGGQIHDYNNELLKNISKGNLEESEFSKNLMGSVEKFNSTTS